MKVVLAGNVILSKTYYEYKKTSVSQYQRLLATHAGINTCNIYIYVLRKRKRAKIKSSKYVHITMLLYLIPMLPATQTLIPTN